MTGKSRNCQADTEPCADQGDGLRLDKWLWQARFFKTRSLAAAVANKGKVRINRMLVTKSHYKVRPGDVLTFAQGYDIRVIRVIALGERRGPAPEARMLYEDIGEPPADKELRQSTERPMASQKREPWGARGGSIDPRRARRQAIDTKMNGR